MFRPAISPSRKAFTLTEILVVIGIMIVLIAILLPALAGVRKAAKRSSVSNMLSSISKSLETFKVDFGDYPDSRNPRTETSSSPDSISFYRVDPIVDWPAVTGQQTPSDSANLTGAHWLARAMAGHDFKGIDRGGKMLGRLIPANKKPADVPGGKIPYNAFTGTGEYAARRAMYLDGNMYSRDDDTSKFNLTLSQTNDYRPRRRIIIYDEAFGSPVLYYKANLLAQSPFCRTGFGKNSMGSRNGDIPGIYCHQDNSYITGDDQSSQTDDLGWDFGSNGRLHDIRDFGLKDTASSAPEITSEISFVGFLRNQAATGPTLKVVPHNPQTFILLTAGPDKIFGTDDDVGNFPIGK